jgi:acyl-CoA hydrolase
VQDNSFFMGANVRKAVNEGRADYSPAFFSEMPLLFRRGITKLDTALISVSPPDKHGTEASRCMRPAPPLTHLSMCCGLSCVQVG